MITFLCNSSFLVIYSVIWIPILYWMCAAEKQDIVFRYGQPYVNYQQHTSMCLPKRG